MLGHELCGEPRRSTVLNLSNILAGDPNSTSLTAHHRYRNLRVYEVSPVMPLPTPQMRAIQVSWGLQHAGYCVKGEDAVSRAQEAGVMLEVEACVALLCEIVSSTSS